MKKERIVWIDVAKFICIMFVMLSHLESCTSPLRTLFSPFFLSLFFFCSGYVYNPNDTFGRFISKKIKQLFIPWLILSTANILLSQILSFNEHMPLGEELFWNFLQIRGLNDGVWFVAALFIAFVPFFFFVRWYQKRSSGIKRACNFIGFCFILSSLSHLYSSVMNPKIFPWNSIALPWHLEYMFIAMFYMFMGYLFKQLFERKFDSWNTASFCLLIWAVYCALLYVDQRYADQGLLFSIISEHITSLVGISAVISICKAIKPGRFILYIGQNSLLCFALHGKVYSLLQIMLKRFANGFYTAVLGNVVASSVFAILLTILISIVLLVPIRIINRYFPFVVGRDCKKTH